MPSHRHLSTRGQAPCHRQAHSTWPGCTKWAVCAASARGTRRQQLRTTGRWQAHLAEGCAFQAGSGQATGRLMSLPPAQGQGSLTLPLLKWGKTERVQSRRDPRDHYVLLSGASASRYAAQDVVRLKEALLGSGQCPRCPRPGPIHLSLLGSPGSISRPLGTPGPRSAWSLETPRPEGFPQRPGLRGALE